MPDEMNSGSLLRCLRGSSRGIAAADGRFRLSAFGGAAITGWYAPPFNDDKRTGLGAWSVGDVVAYLKTGWGGEQVAAGPVAEVV